MSSSSSTASVTTSTTTAVISATNASQTAGGASAQQSSASTTNQVVTAQLTREQRIEELAKKDPKRLREMLKKAIDSKNVERIAEIEAARAIRHTRHQDKTGQMVACATNDKPAAMPSSSASAAAAAAAAPAYSASATAAAAGASSKDIQDHKSPSISDAKAPKGNFMVTAQYVKPLPETLEKYKTDVEFTKKVIGLAVDKTTTDEQLQKHEATATDVNHVEFYRMVRSLRHPFLPEEAGVIAMVRKAMPHLYHGSNCNADVFIKMIAIDSGKSTAELKIRLKNEIAFGDNSSIALTLLALELRKKS